MYTFEKLKKEIARSINEALGKNLIQASDLVYPPNEAMGDLSLPCFNEAKLGMSADELFHQVSSIKSADWNVNMVGKFMNFKLDKTKFQKEVIKEILKNQDKYGSNESGQKKRVMLEYSNANTHKEFHVGHLRNLFLGDSVYRILKANGFIAIPVSYINDFGIHVAKTLWAYTTMYKDKKLPQNRGEFLGKVYVHASQALKESETAKALVEVMMKKIESRQGKEYELWKETREWTIEQFAEIYKDMGIKFEKIMYESEFIDKGRKEVYRLVEQGILKESQGAIIANLEKYGLGVLVIIRSDGTATYPVADIPLAQYKIDKFDLDKSIYVVDNRQTLYFKQLFKILELMGNRQEFVHLAHDFVKLPSGMMSSRSGNVVTYSELKMEMMDRARAETAKRHQEWSKEKIEKTATGILQGAMKFEMLKIGANQEITFDINKALEFSGFTGTYIMYTFARIESIFRKAGKIENVSKIDYSLLEDGREQSLVKNLAKYPEAVLRAAKEYDPSEIAKYVFNLAREFNDYYHAIPVLKAEDGTKLVRLELLKAINQVLGNGLSLLGIKTLKEL